MISSSLNNEQLFNEVFCLSKFAELLKIKAYILLKIQAIGKGTKLVCF